MTSRPLLLSTLAVALWASPASGQAEAPAGHAAKTPWYDGIGRHSRTITTSNDGAQGYFNQGLAFLMAGNAGEAARSFEEAARFDPRCAMAYWGLAMAHGPQLGEGSYPERRNAAAVAALNRAHELAPKATPVEQALITALARRHEDPPPADRRALDAAYADALRELHALYPDDADIGAWRAEALQRVAGAGRWSDAGEPDAATAERVAILGDVLARQENHPLANRLAVLLWDDSPYPERGDAAAERLRALAPGLGPLLHLAAQHEARRGRWSQSIETSLKALAADARYLELSGRGPDAYRLAMARHRLRLVESALMSGRCELALEQARNLTAALPAEWAAQHPSAVDGLVAAPLQVLARFGRWKEVWAEPVPPEEQPLSRTLHHAARGLAAAEQGDAIAARVELAACETAAANVRPDGRWGGRWGGRPAPEVAEVARLILEGRVLLAEGDEEAAVDVLSAAVQKEERARAGSYVPALLPARHALGATLLQRGDVAAAAAVYRGDLERRPENGWALYGLMRCLQEQGEAEEAAAVKARWSEVWKAADAPETHWGRSEQPLDGAVVAER